MTKKLLFRFNVVIALFCITHFTSCTEQQLPSEDLNRVKNYLEESPLSIARDIMTLTSDDANKVAINFSNSNLSTRTSASQDVEDIVTFKDKEGNAAIYAVNFTDDNGFVLISATKKVEPILAYSDKGKIDSKHVPGFDIWLNDVLEDIELASSDTITGKNLQWMQYETKYDNVATTRGTVKYQNVYWWRDETIREIQETDIYDHYENVNLAPDENLDSSYFYDLEMFRMTNTISEEDMDIIKRRISLSGYPEDIVIFHIRHIYSSNHYGPLLQTTWGQRAPYNGKIPNEYLTGCVTIAVSQIMKHNQWPSYFNWNEIDERNTSNLQDYILAVANAVQTEFGADESPSNIEKAQRALRNYGYTTSLVSGINPVQIYSNISRNKPVYLRAENSKSGHAWVCDGVSRLRQRIIVTAYAPLYYRGGENVVLDTNPFEPIYEFRREGGLGESFTLHHNWGWYGLYNGWFSGTNFNPSSEYNFSKNRKTLYISK